MSDLPTLHLPAQGELHMSTLGQYSLYPMLLHEPFMVLPLKWLTTDPGAWSMPYPEDNTPLLAPRLAQFVFAFALTVLCSSWPARKIFGMFIEPTWFDKFVSHARYCEEGLSTQDYLAKSQARASLQKKRLARLREEATKGCVPKSKEQHQSHPLRSLPTVAAPSRLSRRRGPRSSPRPSRPYRRGSP